MLDTTFQHAAANAKGLFRAALQKMIKEKQKPLVGGAEYCAIFLEVLAGIVLRLCCPAYIAIWLLEALLVSMGISLVYFLFYWFRTDFETAVLAAGIVPFGLVLLMLAFAPLLAGYFAPGVLV